MRKITYRQMAIALISIVALSCAGLAAWRIFPSETKTEYITATAERMDIEECVLASGTLEAVKTVAVGAQVSGQLKKLHVALGDRVNKGDLLAEIDPVLQQNTLKSSEAELANVRAQKRSRQAMLAQYELALRRQQQMIAGDASARADLENAQAQVDSTRAEIAALEAKIRQSQVSIDTAKANLGYTRIIAPMDGVVIAIVTEEGQTVVSAQTATTILKLANLDTMTVKAEISEADVTKVKPGQKVWFNILGEPDMRIYGKIRAIEPGPKDSNITSSSSSNGSSGGSSSSSSTAIYYNALFDVPNPQHTLRVSMTAQVSILLKGVKSALCIPVSAMGEREKDGSRTVRVLRDGKPEKRKVRTGITDNINVQVVEGLRRGESVIIGDSSAIPATASSRNSRPPGPPGGR